MRTPGSPLPDWADSRRFTLLFLGLAAILGLDQLVLGPYAVVHFHDSFDVEFLHYLARGRILTEFGLTGWYPDFCGGMPSFVGHLSPYHPLVLLGAVLPLWLLSALGRLLLLFLAGAGMFRLLRGFFGTGRPAAMVGAAVFVLSSMSFDLHSAFNFAFPLFFVWSLEVFDRGLPWPSRAWRLLAMLGISLASYPVLTAPYFPALHLALVLVFGRAPGLTARRVLGVFAVWTGYALLFTPYLASLIQYLPFMQREYAFTYDGLGPALLFVLKATGNLLREDQPGLALALLGLPLVLSSSRVRRALWFVLVPAVIAALSHSPFKALAEGTFLVKLDLGNVGRLMQMVLPLFAALALDERWKRPGPWVIQAVATAVATGLLGPAYVVLAQLGVLGMGLAALGLVSSEMASSGQADLTPRRRILLTTGLLVGLAVAGLLTRQTLMLKQTHVPYHQGYGSHPELAALAAEGRTSPLRAASVDLHPSVAQFAGFETVDQKGVLFNARYKRYMKAVLRPQLTDPTAEKAFDARWYQLFCTMVDIHRDYFLAFNPGTPRQASDWNLDLLAAMNVKYLLSSKPISGLAGRASLVENSSGMGLGLFSQTRADRSYRLPLWVYRLNSPSERGYLAAPRVFADQDAALAALESPEARPGQEAYFTAQDLDQAPDWLRQAGPQAAAAPLSGQARVREYAPDRLVLEGQTQAPCVLVVSNNFDPGWTARVNGQPAPLLRANHAFQAVALAPGPFLVELTYANPLIWRLHWVSLAGLLLFASPLLFRGVSKSPPVLAEKLTETPAEARSGPARPETPGDPGLSASGGPEAPSSSAPLWAALAMTAVWGLSFGLSVWAKRDETERPVLYILWTGLVLGPLLGLWAARAMALWQGPGPGEPPKA